MRLRRRVRNLLAGLVGGFAFACSAPTHPGEAPPLAPRPVPVQPVPGDPRPVPGAADPLAKPTDAGVPFTRVQLEPHQPAHDAGVDAPEAPRSEAAAQFLCC